MRVCKRNGTIGTQLTRIEQQPRRVVRRVLAIKRSEFLILQTLLKKVSLSSFGNRPDRVCAQQLFQTQADTFALRQR